MISESCWGNEGLSPLKKKNVPMYQGLVLAELAWVLLPALMFDLTEGELASGVKTIIFTQARSDRRCYISALMKDVTSLPLLMGKGGVSLNLAASWAIT